MSDPIAEMFRTRELYLCASGLLTNARLSGNARRLELAERVHRRAKAAFEPYRSVFAAYVNNCIQKAFSREHVMQAYTREYPLLSRVRKAPK